MYINGSPYRDAEVLSQLRSCLHDVMINADLRIGGKLKIWDFIDSVPHEE